MIILSVVLVLLIALCILLVMLPRLYKNDTDAGHIETITNPVKISFNGGGGQDIYEFVLKDGTWSYTGNTAYPIAQTYLVRIINALSQLQAQRIIAISDSMASYGLDPAKYILTVQDENGKTLSMKIGTSAGEDSCYALVEGVDGICIIPASLSGHLTRNIFEMIDSESISSMSEEDITDITISAEGTSAVFRQEDGTWYYLSESGEYVVEEDYSAVGSDGESHTVRKYLNDISDALPSIKSSGCCGYFSTADELSRMGLTSPALTAKFTMSNGTVNTYLIGESFSDEEENTYHYFTMPGLDGVYKMELSGAAPLFEALKALGR